MKENPNIVVTNSLSGSGFLSGFIEASIEKPDDGLNGDCIVHYAGKHSKFEMTVKLVNGVREGKAVIVNDGMPCLRLEYKQGSLTGVVERMSESGSVELRGHLVSGVESGFFEEYDSRDQVVWRGYYKNGVRDSKSRLVRKGKDSVRSVEEGEFYELDENGVVSQLCLYENGLRSRVIASYVGDVMTELDENGKRVYEGGFKGDIENGFVRDGKGKEFVNGGKTVVYLGEWKNGKREGVGTEYKGMTAVYIGEWKNGKRDGKGKEMDENGRVVYEGEWREGKWNGRGEEWRNGGSRFGEWKNGVVGNGLVYEMDEKRVVKQVYWYENGEMKRVVLELELFHMILSRRIDYGVMKYLDPFSFFMFIISTGHAIGVFQLYGKHFYVDWFGSEYLGAMVDMDSKEMIAYANNERNIISFTKEVIDLNVNGRRWEGCVRDEKPFGYGVVYDDEGRKEYEGFMIDGMKTCCGTEYYSDIGRVEYEGGYYDNKRFGKGILYDRNGVVEYDDLWKDDEPYSSSSDGRTIDNHTESITIPDKSFNESKSFIPLFFLHSLKRIVIGDECFGSVRVFELNGLSELEIVVIGQRSFRISYKERTDDSCRIVNCPKLKSIQIDDLSFGDYHSFELSNLPSLQSIAIGDYCFRHAPSFSLIGLID